MGHFIPPCLLQVIARPIFWSLFWYKDNDTANNTSSTVYIIRYMLFSSSKIQGRRYSHIRPLRDLPWTDCQRGGRNHRLGWSRWTGEWRRRRAAWPAERGWNSAYAVLLYRRKTYFWLIQHNAGACLRIFRFVFLFFVSLSLSPVIFLRFAFSLLYKSNFDLALTLNVTFQPFSKLWKIIIYAPTHQYLACVDKFIQHSFRYAWCSTVKIHFLFLPVRIKDVDFFPTLIHLSLSYSLQ